MQKTTTPVAPGFEWTDGPPGQALVCVRLQRLAPHVFTTRALTFRAPTEADDWRRLEASLGVIASAIVRVRQVHGRTVVVVRDGPPIPSVSGAEADAIVSQDRARAIAVRVADCVPVLIADVKQRVVAAVHAGWRGTASNVAGAAVQAIAALRIPPADLVAAIGPSIGPCCYQVDAPVRASFLASQPHAEPWFVADGSDRWRLDLWQANADQLVAAGVPREAIETARLCTFDRPDLFHSFRRDGGDAGRMVAAIRLTPTSSELE